MKKKLKIEDKSLAVRSTTVLTTDNQSFQFEEKVPWSRFDQEHMPLFFSLAGDRFGILENALR